MKQRSRHPFNYLLAGLSGTALLPATVAWANPSDANYRLIFADEFNGTKIDTSKWAVASPSWTMPNSLSTAKADQVSVANGMMTMNAVRTGSNTWNSGSISTYGKYTFTGGYVEARIQLPTTPGSWPAFWGLKDGWPPEADIMEYPLTTNGGADGYASNAYHTAFHYKNGSGGNSSGAGKVTTGSSLAGTWHTFAMDWTNGSSVKFLLDGVQKTSFDSSSVSQMTNMYMILDYAVGGWPGTPSTGQWGIGESDQTNVDWVHVWQKHSNGDNAVWNVSGSGNFATAGNWTGAGVPKYGNQIATFGRVGTAATSAVSMPNGSVFGGITFAGLASGTNAGTTAYTIGSSSNVIQLASTAGPVIQAAASSTVGQTVNSRVELWNSSTFTNAMTGGQTLSFNGAISGNGGLTVTGVGATVLNAANSYTGGTTIGQSSGAGVLRAAATGALGSGTLTFDAGGNGSTARLELTNNVTLANNVSLAGRNNASVAIQNLAGNNTLSGTITAGTGGNTYTLQSDGGTLTLSGSAANATASGVALQAGSGVRVFMLQGAGDGVVSGRVQNGGGTVGITKAGTGTWTLAANNSFTGATTVNAGRLVLANSGTMAGLTVGSGATLAARGNLAHSGPVAVNGALDLTDGGVNTVSTTSSLSLANATLNFELGNGAAADKLAAAGPATVAGTNTINLNAAAGQSISNGSSYTVVTAASGLNAADFTVGSKPASLGFYDFTLSTPGGTALRVTASGNPTPTTAYFTGAGSTATADAANNWGAGAAVQVSNWAADAAGTLDAKQVPGSITDVVVSATNANTPTVSTQLDAAYAIKGLAFDTAAGVFSANVATNNNPLTVGTSGISVANTSAGSGFVSGTGGVRLAASQSWANQSDTKSLTVSTGVTPVSGATTLTLNGIGIGGVTITGVLADGGGTLSTVFNQAGVTTLSAANTYTGSTTVNAGTVDVTGRLAGNATVGNGGTLRLIGNADSIADTAGVSVLAGGTLDVRGAAAGAVKSETINTLSGGGTVTRGNSGLSTLTVNAGVFTGSITNGNGTLALAKTGNSTLTLAGDSNYAGGTTITDAGGDLLVTHGNALGTGPVVIGTGGSEPTGTLQIAGNVTLGVAAINLSSRSTTSNGGVPTIENVSGNNAVAANLNINSTGGTAANIVSTAGTLTLTGNLGSTGLASARGFDFAGGGNGVVTGTITNGTAQPTFVQKNDTGTWTLAGNNTYTAGTTVNGGTLDVTGSNTWGTGGLTVNDGVAVLSNNNTYTGGTTITGQTVGGDNGGSLDTGGRVVMAHPTALGAANSPVTMSGNATLEIATDGGDRPYNLQVGTDNIVNLVSGTKTGNSGINHTLGTLSIGHTDTVNVTAGADVASGSPSITITTVNLSSGFGAGSTTFNPTTAGLKLGTVSTSTPGTKTLVLDGTAIGNAVTGPVFNNVSTVAVVKRGSGTWQLAAANTYTGGTTLNDGGGALLVTHGSALGSGALTIGNGGTNASGKLQLAGNINLNSVPTINLAGRALADAGGAPTIENASGNNVITSPLIFKDFGGNAVNVLSTAGRLTLNSGFTAATVTGPRGVHLYGDGDGAIHGPVSNGTATVFVQKAGTGTWTLAGNNTYSGATTVLAGELRATPAAYNNFLTNAGGVDLAGATARLTLDYAGGPNPAATVRSLLAAGVAGNFATGQLRATNLSAGQTIGYADTGSTVTLRVTLPGDTNLDGAVGFDDFVLLQTNFGQTGVTFAQGDYDYNNVVNFDDFVLLQTAFGTALPGNRAAFAGEQFAAVMSITNATQVPEPATLSIIGLSAAVLRRRRRA